MSLIPPPSNNLVTAMLTDLYQITMTYAHWKNGRHEDPAVFELFFRKNPFGGKYTVFCGLEEVLRHVQHFSFGQEDVAYLRSVLPHCEDAFWDDYLLRIDCRDVTIRAMREGTVAFPREPLVVVQAPLGVGQLLETTLLTLINYPSLIATNASRMVMASEKKKQQQVDGLPPQCYQEPKCVEFGLRRAQGPDGGFSASKYATMGGFVGTSNVQAGKLLGLHVSGTHAHAFVQAYHSLDQVQTLSVKDELLLPRVLAYREELGYHHTNDGELAAFCAYAAAFPATFLCLIDTYDTLKSGLLNFILVALVLDDLGFVPRGIRLDSGNLARLSMDCARVFATQKRPCFGALDIVASNDIHEDTLHELGMHAITVFGIGTNLVTCQKQPALGCVYKLVEISGVPRMKLSQDIAKVLIPGRKAAYRLVGSNGTCLLDVLVRQDEDAPTAQERFLCRHAFDETTRVAVTPTQAMALHHVFFQHGRVTEAYNKDNYIVKTREYVQQQLQQQWFSSSREYPVYVSNGLYDFLHQLWQTETPITELS